MPNPEQERMDALSEAIRRVLRRMDAIETRLTHLEAASWAGELPKKEPIPPPAPPPLVQLETPPVEPPPVEIPAAEPPAPPLTPVMPPPQETVPPEPAPQAFETRMGLTWINRIGVVTLVLGVAFFFKYAVDNQWIGETGRVALGVLAGLVALFIGDRVWHRQQKVFAQGITGLGIALLYLSFYAGFGFYHFLPQSLAFLLMVLTTAAAAALAIRYEAQAIAALGLLGGYATPVLLSTGVDHPWIFFGYISLLDIGALVIARVRKWLPLTVLAFVATGILYASWYGEWFKPEKQLVATIFVFVFYALFATVEFVPIPSIMQVLAAIALSQIWPIQTATFLLLGLVLAAAGLALADRRQWQAALTTAFAGFWLSYWLWSAEADFSWTPPVNPAFLLLTVAFLLFFSWLPWRVMVRKQAPKEADLIVLAANAAAYFGASYVLLKPAYNAYLGLFAVAVAAAHLLLGRQLWYAQPAESRDPKPPLLAVGVALGFLTLAAPIQFSGYRITMAWSLEAAALAWISAKLGDSRLRVFSLLVFAMAVLRLFILNAWIYPDARLYSTILNGRYLTFLITAASCWLAAYWMKRDIPSAGTYIAGHFVLLWSCGIEVIGWAERNASGENLMSVETVGISVLMAVYAVLLVVIGVSARSVLNRILGLGLIAIVVLKLYLIDVWQLSRLFRMAAFVALGVLLLLTSYLYSRFKPAIERWWRDES